MILSTFSIISCDFCERSRINEDVFVTYKLVIILGSEPREIESNQKEIKRYKSLISNPKKDDDLRGLMSKF